MECGFDVRKAEQAGHIGNDMSFEQLVLGWEAIIAGKPNKGFDSWDCGCHAPNLKGSKT